MKPNHDELRFLKSVDALLIGIGAALADATDLMGDNRDQSQRAVAKRDYREELKKEKP